jgi:predicted nucleotidyltransferase
MTDLLDDFEHPLQALLKILKNENIPHVIIGGLAVSQLSRPRLTADIDILTYLDDDTRIPKLIESALSTDFSLRIDDAEQFARQNRVLLLIHNQTQIHVDVSLGLLPFEREVIERSSRISVGEFQLPLPSVEDLIILKAVAHRRIDLQDITNLFDTHHDLDRQRVKRIVAEFAEALEMPEILQDVMAILEKSAT